jgi:hypothetical protein
MPDTYYTIKGRCDGFGAQYLSILSGIAYCDYNNYIYIHTPFKHVCHKTDTRKANDFIGINNNSFSYDNRCTLIEKTYEEEVHYSNTPSMYYTDSVLEKIRKSYYSSEKPLVGKIDIALHIRRGDVNKEQNENRYVDNSVYVKIVDKLKEKYPSYTITVFSEGVYEDFNDLGLEEHCFKLNTDVFETFHSLVTSKVLIQGWSSFSYCAGLINSNIVYHDDTLCHRKLDHWMKISELVP